MRGREVRAGRWPAAILLLAVLSIGAAGQASGDDGSQAATGPVRVIVQVATDREAPELAAGLRAASSSARRDVVEAVEERAGQLVRHARALPYAVVEISADQTDALARDPRVAAVHEDVAVELALSASVPLVAAKGLEHPVGVQLTGAGTAIVIIDAGVQADHPFLQGASGSRVLAEACFAGGGEVRDQHGNLLHTLVPSCRGGAAELVGPGSAAPLLGNSHGTHVAGIAAGSSGEPAGSHGVAPKSGILAVQVFSADDAGGVMLAFTSDLLSALDWVLERSDSYGVAAVNLSVGGGAFDGACDDVSPWTPIRDAVAALREAGVITVAASGNDQLRNHIAAPACLSPVVAVAASTGEDEVASFSNMSEDVDLLAPGVSIDSSVVGSGYWSLSGTSMATPHVSGAVALLRQAEPTATTAHVVGALRASNVRIDDERSDGSVTDLPRLHLPSALAHLTGAELPPSAPALTSTNGDPRVVLSWTDPGSASSFRLHRSTGSGCTSTDPLVYHGSVRSYEDVDVVHSRTYRYCVTAVEASGTSPLSNVRSVTARDLTAPAAPSLSTKGGKREVTISWPAVTEPTGPVTYRVYRSTTMSCSANSRRIATTTARSVTDTGLEGATAYSYCATATDGAGNRSGLSTTRSATTSGYPDHGFKDVPRGSWYDVPVRYLKAEGITQGKGGPGLYSPGSSVTRAEMAAFLWRAAGEPRG